MNVWMLRFALLGILIWQSALLPAQTPRSYAASLKEAERLFESGNLTTAAERFAALATQFPNEPQPYWYLGVIAFQQKESARAAEAFAELTARQPDRGAGWIMRGLSEFRTGRFEDALPHIEKGRFLGGTGNAQLDSSAALTQAMLCNRIGRFDVALAVLSEIAVQGSKSPAAIATFGLAALNRPQMLNDVAKEEQPLVMAVGETAWAIGAKKTEESIRLAEALQQQFPQASGLHYVLGTALLRNNWERAEQEFRAEIQANPKHYFANVTLATELIERQRMQDALPFARAAVALRADHFVAQTLLGRALLGTGAVEEAVTHLEEAVKLEPENRNARYSLSLAYARAGRKEEAERQREIFAAMQQTPEAKP